MYNILIADDSKPDVDCIAFLIRKHQLPCIIHTAYDGQDAVDLLFQEDISFDILLTDIKMPYVNGLDLARLAQKRFPNIKIILFSGFEDFEYARSAMSIGITNYLTKPVLAETYLNTLNKIIGELDALSQEKVSLHEYLSSSDSSRYFDMLSEDLSNGNISLFLSHLEEFQAAAADGGATSYSIIYAKYNFINLCKLLLKLGTAEQDISRLSNDIFNANDVHELIQITRELALFIRQTSEGKTPDNQLSQQIKQYIAENYSQPLSLDSIAAHFYISSNYLCSIFKKETGDNLNRFINHYRLEQACRLLRTTNMKIKDIAQITGYQNTSYFCQRFRDTYHQSPESFRQNKPSV